MAARKPILISSEQVKVQRLAMQRRIGIGMMVSSVAAFALSFLGPPVLGAAVSMVWWVVFLLGAMATGMARRDPGTVAGLASHAEPGSVELSDEALRVAYGSRFATFPLDQFETGWIEEGEQIDTLVLRTKKGETILSRLHISQRDDAQALLRRMGLDERAVRLVIGNATRAGRGCASGCLPFALFAGVPLTIFFVVSLAMALFGDLPFTVPAFMFPFAGLFMAVAYASAYHLASAELTIGSDGVWIKTSPWHKRFVPFDELKGYRTVNDRAYLELGDEPLRIRCQNEDGAKAVIERIDRAKRRWKDGAASIDLAELDRGKRPLGEWRDHVRALLERATAYRDRALSLDDLWSVVRDASATPERRVGAALALSGRIDDEERERIRVAAQSCATGPLRIAIDSAAAGELEEAALEEAMAAYKPSHAEVHTDV